MCRPLAQVLGLHTGPAARNKTIFAIFSLKDKFKQLCPSPYAMGPRGRAGSTGTASHRVALSLTSNRPGNHSLVSSSQLFRHEVSYELLDRLGSRRTSRSSCDPSAAFLVMAQDIPQREPDMTSIDKNSLSQGIWDSPMAFQV